MDISQERGRRLLLEPSSYFLDDPCPFCRGHLPTESRVLECLSPTLLMRPVCLSHSHPITASIGLHTA